MSYVQAENILFVELVLCDEYVLFNLIAKIMSCRSYVKENYCLLRRDFVNALHFSKKLNFIPTF